MKTERAIIFCPLHHWETGNILRGLWFERFYIHDHPLRFFFVSVSKKHHWGDPGTYTDNGRELFHHHPSLMFFSLFNFKHTISLVFLLYFLYFLFLIRIHRVFEDLGMFYVSFALSQPVF